MDYRKYLLHYYNDRKERFKFFSYRYFSKKAGISSASLYREVVSGKRNLTAITIPAFSKGLGLKDVDAKYFEALVYFNQSENPKEKQLMLEKMRRLKQSASEHRLPVDHFVYYANWYNLVIRELVCTINWKDDYAVLAKSVIPGITIKQAQESVKLLLDLGLIKKTKEGVYRQVEAVISTGPEVDSSVVRILNRELTKLGEEAIERFPNSMRDISTLIVGISNDGYSRIKQEIQDFKRRIIQIANEDVNSDQVYSMNMQLFPMSENDSSMSDKCRIKKGEDGDAKK